MNNCVIGILGCGMVLLPVRMVLDVGIRQERMKRSCQNVDLCSRVYYKS